MAALSVRAGLNLNARLPATTLVVVGQNRHLKATKFETLSEKFAGTFGIRFCVYELKMHSDESAWKKALELAPTNGSLPLVFNQAKLISLPDTASRCNSPANSAALFAELKSIKAHKGCKNVSVVIVAEYAHVVASVSAVARSFPTFSRKTKVEDQIESVELEVVVTDKALSPCDVEALSAMCSSIRDAIRLGDMPANILTTDKLVEEAQTVAKEVGAKVTLIRGNELLEKGFGGIYHVGKAGPTPPAFVVLSHEVKGAEHTTALVGKGVVFDTGGMQIKGKTAMPNMKRDMGGAAGMLHAFRVLVKAGYKQNLHVCLCIVENNISPAANKPDDIITMLSGKTVEINNTDAEGRLILADGVFYAKTVLKAQTIVDMATLTGAQSWMTGKLHGAVLTNSESWENKTVVAGRRSGDLVAPMVFCPDLHFSDLKSPLADMKNSNLGKMEVLKTGPPSAIAGLFIGSHIEFGEGLDWIHLDIAAPAESGDRGTGYGVALLSCLLGNHTKTPIFQ